MRVFFTSIVILVIPLALSGQTKEPCKLGIDQAPAIRGIRLGMTLSEVRVLYPIIPEPKERDADGTSTIYYSCSLGYDEGLKGIESLFLHLFSGRIYNIKASYKEPNYLELTELTKPFAFPYKMYATTECQGFSVSLFRHSDSQSLELSDTRAQRKMIEFANEIKENSADCQKAPMIRDVKLGMTVAQFRTLYPRSQIARKRTEVGEVILRHIDMGDPRLKGISTLWSYFLDDELYLLVVDYGGPIEWKDIDQFVEQFSKATGLRTEWEGSSEALRNYITYRTLRCRSFIIKAEIVDGHPRLTIQDRPAVSKLIKREEQLKSPTTFRP